MIIENGLSVRCHRRAHGYTMYLYIEGYTGGVGGGFYKPRDESRESEWEGKKIE